MMKRWMPIVTKPDEGVEMSLAVQVALWDAINAYAAACGGDPSRHVYGNTQRMTAVVDISRAIHNIASLCSEQMKSAMKRREAFGGGG